MFWQSSNTSATPTPEESKNQCAPSIDEEAEMTLQEEEKPPVSSAASPYLTSEQSPSDEIDSDYYYRSYKKISDPIPIG